MTDTIFGNNIAEIIKRVASSNNIQNYEVGTVQANATDEGYLSQIFTATILDKSDGRELNLLLKLSLKSETTRKASNVREAFENEIYFYSVIYPTLQKLRKSSKEEYGLVPKCYQTSFESRMEFLVLENLRCEEKGFELFDKTLHLTGDHFGLMFQRYGYFHAHFFALKHQNPRKFAEVLAPIKNVHDLLSNKEGFKSFLKRLCEEVNSLFDPEDDYELIESFRDYVSKPVELFKQVVDDGGEYSTILHGDCSVNNMLFKYDKASGKPIDIRLIDWQLVKAGSPVCDLSYALYADGSKANLDKLDEFLQIYYNSLSSTLRKLGSDPEKVLPFNALKEQWKIYSKFGLLMGIRLIRLKCRQMNDSQAFPARVDSGKFAAKMRDLLSHMHTIGAL